MQNPTLSQRALARPTRGLWIAAAAGLAASALLVREETNRAEREFPPTGAFIERDGVRLHYIDTGGAGPALVVFHGNGAMIADIELSGLVEAAASRYRVIVFDRPGYGYSTRPRDRTWGPEAQADLFASVFAEMGLVRPLALGHSWGTQVALRLALDHPDSVAGLALVSGYYFPSLRADSLAAAPTALPILGDLVRNTVSPFLARLTAPGSLRKMFAPQALPERYRREFPVGLTLRPSQIRASSQESALMVPAAAAMASRYASLRLPVSILAGSEDRIVDPDSQSGRLHRMIPGSQLQVLPGLGHMLHHFAVPRVLSAVDAVAARAEAEPAGV